MSEIVIFIIVIALVFDFLNGFHDSANSIATVVATRVLKPWQAVLMAAFANFSAFFFFSTAVAATIGKGIIQPDAVTSEIILAGLIGACIWNILTWYFGLPVSSSHALIGGLVGATINQIGPEALIFAGLNKVFLFIIVAPLLGMAGAFLFTKIITFFVRNGSRDVLSRVFAKLQIVSSFWYSMGHGANDAQKTMGVITLTLYSNGLLGGTFHVPFWVVLASYSAMGIGTYFGGWRIVKTMGSKIIHLKPFQGFCAETSSAVTLFFTSHFGIPVSTTHVIAGSIMGVGSAKNYKQVKWTVGRKIFVAWVVTIPVSMVFGMLANVIINFF